MCPETDVVMATAVAEERDLIRRSQAGEREAFGLLVRNYMDRAYHTTYALVGNHADAVELSQEAFARAYRALDRFDSEEPFYPWFHRILRNLAYDRLRRRRLEPRTADLSSPGAFEPSRAGGDDPADMAEQREAEEALRLALAGLPAEEREVTWLKLVEGLSYRAIAEQAGVSATTVSTWVASARRKLRYQLRSYL